MLGEDDALRAQPLRGGGLADVVLAGHARIVARACDGLAAQSPQEGIAMPVAAQ